MDEFGGIGRFLLLVGAGLAGVGAVLVLLGKVPGAVDWLGWLGRLPGDIAVKREHYSFYFPLATSLLISAVLSLLWYLLSLVGKR